MIIQMFMLMLAAIYVLFLVTYLPTLLVRMFDKDMKHTTLHILTYVINWASVVINPIVYVVSQRKYQVGNRCILFWYVCCYYFTL